MQYVFLVIHSRAGSSYYGCLREYEGLPRVLIHGFLQGDLVLGNALVEIQVRSQIENTRNSKFLS